MPIFLSSCAMPPVHSLPIELLRTIFELSVFSQPLPDDRNNTLLTAEVILSHVCRHWRSVALDNPLLWSLIHLRTRTHLGRARAYLARSSINSSRTTLDIYVDTCSESTHEVRKDRLFRDEFLSVFDILVPEIGRWREFHLKVADLVCKAGARKVLSTCGTAPNLRTLQLWHVQDWGTSEHLYSAIGPPPVVVFDGALPALRHIVLQGVNLPWTLSPFLRDLFSIEYAVHSDDVRMPFRLWHDMLVSSPRLRRLALLYSGPRAHASDGAHLADGIDYWGADPPDPALPLPPGAALPPAAEPAVLPALAELAVQQLELGYLVKLFRTFDAPALRALTVELEMDEGEDYAPFLRYLVAPPPLTAPAHLNGHAHRPERVKPRPKFPRLEKLAVEALMCSVAAWREFLESAAGLTRLEVDFVRMTEGAFEVLFETIKVPREGDRGGGGEGEGEKKGEKAKAAVKEAEEVPILPNLQSIRVSGVDGKDLARLAAFRRARGRRIRRWEVEESFRDADGAALEREMAEISRRHVDAERARNAALPDAERRPAWTWDEPLERIVWFALPIDCATVAEDEDEEGEYDDGGDEGDEEYADEEGEEA